MNEALRNTMAILGYNTWLFRNALKDVEPELVEYRVNEHTNTFNRLAGHVAVGRFGTARMLHIDAPEPGWGAFQELGLGRQFDLHCDCPPLEDILTSFNQITEPFLARLPEVSLQLLQASASLPIPGENPTMADQLAFMTMHETYHIGQMGLLKKSMGGAEIMSA